MMLWIIRYYPGQTKYTTVRIIPRRSRFSYSPVAVESHNPAQQHHFADMEQQRQAASLGMWLFLATEVMFFGGMFCAYLIYRYWYFPEFAAGIKTLAIRLGAINTAVLIFRSITVALSVRAAQ